MTLKELQAIARNEFNGEGQLSKGTRVSIIEKARAGEAFKIVGSMYDVVRISAALRKHGEKTRMTSCSIEAGKRIEMNFNKES